MRLIGSPPTDGVTLDALQAIGNLLGVDLCWFHRGRFHFRMSEEWTVAISPESAGRLQVETCHLTVPRDRKWCLAADRNRLMDLVREARNGVPLLA